MKKKTWEEAEIYNFEVLKSQGKNVLFNNTDLKYDKYIMQNERTLNHPDFQILKKLGATEKARCLRGDITEILPDGSKNIYDVKNYSGIRGWGSDQINSKDYVKTIDTNFDYAFQFFTEDLLNNYLNKKSLLARTDGNDFIDFYMKLEASRYYLKLNIKNKYLIINEGGDFFQYKIDFSSIKNKQILIKSYFSDKGYDYIQFVCENQIIYEISQRANGVSNCGMVLKKFIIKQEDIHNKTLCMPKKYKEDIISFIKNNKGSITSESIVEHVIKLHSSYFSNTNFSNKEIRIRILKDLNPRFKQKCISVGIHYNSETRTFYNI